MILLVFASGCSEDAANVPGETFADLRKTSREVFTERGTSEKREELVEKLLGAGVDEGLLDQEAPRRSLMAVCSDDSVGIFVLKKMLREIPSASHEERLRLIRGVQNDFPETVLSLAALQEELGILAHSIPEAFLMRCQQVFSASDSERSMRVALLEQARFLSEKREYKRSALNYARFWALYPDVVEQGGYDREILNALRDGGFVLERDLLSSSPEPARDAEGFYLEMRDLPDSANCDVLTEANHSFSLSYYRNAPDWEESLAAVCPETDSPYAEALFYLRLLRFDSLGSALQRKTEVARNYVAAAHALIDSGSTDDADIAFLKRANDLCVDYFMELYADGTLIEERSVTGLSSSAEAFGCIRDMSSISTKAARYLTISSQPEDVTGFALATECHVDVLKKLNIKNEVVPTLRDCVSQFPDAESSRGLLLEIARFWRESLRVPSRACQVYEELLEKYSDTVEAETASLELALLYYQRERYGDAFLVSEGFQEDCPESNKIPAMAFLSALSQAGLGDAETCERQMRVLADKYPQHPVAERALFWLGSNKLVTQDYADARVIYEELTDRYPGGSYSTRAKQYIERLAALE